MAPGILPVRELDQRLREVREVKLRRLRGMGPWREFPLRSRDARGLSPPIAAGMLPEI